MNAIRQKHTPSKKKKKRLQKPTAQPREKVAGRKHKNPSVAKKAMGPNNFSTGQVIIDTYWHDQVANVISELFFSVEERIDSYWNEQVATAVSGVFSGDILAASITAAATSLNTV